MLLLINAEREFLISYLKSFFFIKDKLIFKFLREETTILSKVIRLKNDIDSRLSIDIPIKKKIKTKIFKIIIFFIWKYNIFVYTLVIAILPLNEFNSHNKLRSDNGDR